MLSSIFLLNLVIIPAFTQIPQTLPNLKNERTTALPPCQACKMLVSSFKNGMDKTARNKYEGGDTAWEESRLGSYANSELRLVEIEENLCTDLDKGKHQCHQILEEHDSLLEEWWKNHRDEDLHDYLCIQNLKVCCPENHYGPECKPCKGGIENPCSGNGFCKGGGTRKGSGECKCNEEYGGDLCDQCKVGYFNESQANGKWKCTKCDVSCKGHCWKEGPLGCEVCANGYQHTKEYGCVDVDECIESSFPVCFGNTFCANVPGSYRCLQCDKACEGCFGDGPDMCNKCAEGFTKKNEICTESAALQREFHAEITRYATYLGLCIATLIIFRKNIIVASIIGLAVAMYISLSEYTIGDWERRQLFKDIRSWFMV